MTRRSSIIALALAATAALPASAPAVQDLRMPDQRDPVSQSAPAQDLRAPDRRAPFVPVSETSTPPAPVRDDGGFGWSEVGLGAGAAFVLVVLATGGAAASRRHAAAPR